MSPMLHLCHGHHLPRHLAATFVNGRYYRRTFSAVAPYTIVGKWPTRRFVMAGRNKKATPAKNRRPQSFLLGSSKRPLLSHEDQCSFLKLRACCIGLLALRYSRSATRSFTSSLGTRSIVACLHWSSGLHKHHHLKATWRRDLVAQE